MTNDFFTPNWLGERRRRLANLELGPETAATGRVEQVADGIAGVSGLPDAALGAVLSFGGGKYGFVQSLERDIINVVLLDDASAVEAGDRVIDTGDMLRAPVGEALLGRIVDPLGRPLDDGPPLEPHAHHIVDTPVPPIIERDQVREPVESGLLVIDSLFALGRGQRELVIGDRATGKTALATDIMINQKNSDLICIYVAVGQRTTAVERVISAVRQNGAPERCIFVVAGAASAPGLQWIAPFAGQTMAEYFRDKGQHALIVFDDLTRHAATHRELALLTREPPGREAYPGDIFYLHARLLERSAKLGNDRGGGSVTALPIAETDAGNLSAYIPTNLISITDGQIFLNSHLFAANQLPAVDVGLSLSRVGGKAQTAALRSVSRRLRLDFAQFQELELFTRLGGITNPRVSRQIARGKRIRGLLNQPRFSGLRLSDQVALLAALEDGILDGVGIESIPELRQRLPRWIDQNCARAVTEVHESGNLSEETRQALVAAVSELAGQVAAIEEPAG